MKIRLRRQMSRFAIILAVCILASQLLLYGFVELTDLSWPPSSWPWVIRERIAAWFSEPGELAHEVRELSSLLFIGLASMPVIIFSVWRYSKRVFGTVEEIAARATEISAGAGLGRLPVGSDADCDEISVMARACNLAFERYEETFHRLERFTRDASHQLRTPLASIRALGEVSLSHPRSVEQYQDTIGRMLEQSDRLLSTIEVLLDVARRDPRATRSRFRPLDLRRLGEEVVRQYTEWAEAKSIRLLAEPCEGVSVPGDADLLEQALCNLVDNAVRITPEKGRITVRTGLRGTEAYVEVEDTGPGMREADRELLFEPHQRAQDSPHRRTGLGLSIVSDVMRLHEGRIEVESEWGKGSLFRLILPRS